MVLPLTGVAWSVSSCPLRSTSRVRRLPVEWCTRFESCVSLVILVPSIATIWSPTLRPASWAAFSLCPCHGVKADTPTWVADGAPMNVRAPQASTSAMMKCMSEPAEANRTFFG